MIMSMDRSRRSGSVDDVVRYVIQDLDVRLPLALLLVSTLPAELDQRLQSIDYVERDVLTAVPTDHLAGRGADVDFEIWLDTDNTHLPQRLAITYKNEEGAPQYRAEFSDWKFEPRRFAGEPRFQPAGWSPTHPVPGQGPPAPGSTSQPQPVKPLPLTRQPHRRNPAAGKDLRDEIPISKSHHLDCFFASPGGRHGG